MILVGRVLLISVAVTVAGAVGVLALVLHVADLMDQAEQELGS